MRGGVLIASRDLAMGVSSTSSARASEPRDREDIAARLVDAIGEFAAAIGGAPGEINQVCVCGGHPELRSMTAPLMEQLDVEVEPLDSLFGIDAARLPEPADEFRERSAELRLAWAAAADSPPTINLLRARNRQASKTMLARAAVVDRRGGRARGRVARPESVELAGPDPHRAVGRECLSRCAQSDGSAFNGSEQDAAGGDAAAARTPPVTPPTPVTASRTAPMSASPVAASRTSSGGRLWLRADADYAAAGARGRTPPVVPPPRSRPAAAAVRRRRASRHRRSCCRHRQQRKRGQRLFRRWRRGKSRGNRQRSRNRRSRRRPATPAPLGQEPPRARARPAPPPEVALPFEAVVGTILYSPDRKLAIIDGHIVRSR